MASGKRVVVVGGGVIGLCTAYYALQRSHRVTIVERGGPDHDCCSLGNAGMIVPSHFVPLAAPGMIALGLRMMLRPAGPFRIRPRLSWELADWCWKFCRSANAEHVERSAPLLCDLHLASRELFEELAGLPGADFGLTRRGLLMACKTERALHEESGSAEFARRLGLPADVLSAEEVARLEPGMRWTVAGGVYFPQDCHLVPPRFMATMTRVVQEAGAEFAWSSDVIGWRHDGGRVAALRTGRGEIGGDEFVLAAGSWSSQVARELGVYLPMQAGKGYSLTLTQPRQMPSIGIILVEARVAVTPMGSDLRFAGTLEIAGLDESINLRRVRGIVKSIPRYLPDFGPDDFRDVPAWRGLRPCSPDGLPYVGRPRGWANLCVATGHAMMGLSLGPITGKLVAAIVSDEPPPLDVTQLSPDRFCRRD